tara:strand:+ start:1635 stop:2981 length:1347 start_codon:yes stop_codon:yes gene_type:complete
MSKLLASFSDEQVSNATDNHLVVNQSGNEKPDSIIITIDATHAGYKNKNFFYYDPQSMKYAVQQDTWTKPFAKPLLKNHDLESEPLGRVQAARYIDTMDGKGYTQLDVKVTDSEAIDKILDGRYLTVSTHGAPMKDADLRHNFVQCSVCGTNLNQDEWCGHSRGQMYEDEDTGREMVCFWKVGAMDYKEVSIVNNPADNDGSTAAQITAVSMIDGENPAMGTDEENKNSNFLIFKDSDVEYADESFLNLEDQKSVVANIALWDSVGQDAEKYVASKGLILSANKPFKGDIVGIAGDADGDLLAEDDSKAGYPPNCNAGYKVATVEGEKKCVSSKGKTSSKKSYDAEALLEDILNIKTSETDANTKSVEKKSNSSEDSEDTTAINDKEYDHDLTISDDAMEELLDKGESYVEVSSGSQKMTIWVKYDGSKFSADSEEQIQTLRKMFELV